MSGPSTPTPSTFLHGLLASLAPKTLNGFRTGDLSTIFPGEDAMMTPCFA
eukprot:CAMPEP_0184302744 /NCGR_PEP_ID=MMETSP1049-20130417/12635_1 /TAXON_ID=77928 /ORGANISM="Proteomonas sulcata, Strain CCMP704" /LENGTH=49 /DNA_ID=CAMNT_0026614087 /DNA_START=179 /DNA_END=328 /DNA_ORIENTATION=-